MEFTIGRRPQIVILIASGSIQSISLLENYSKMSLRTYYLIGHYNCLVRITTS